MCVYVCVCVCEASENSENSLPKIGEASEGLQFFSSVVSFLCSEFLSCSFVPRAALPPWGVTWPTWPTFTRVR